MSINNKKGVIVKMGGGHGEKVRNPAVNSIYLSSFYKESVSFMCFCILFDIQVYISNFSFQTERTYFNVFLPREGKDSSLPMFFCSKWSVGKVVDYAASLASLKNNNNVLTAKVTENSLEQQVPINLLYRYHQTHF